MNVPIFIDDYMSTQDLLRNNKIRSYLRKTLNRWKAHDHEKKNILPFLHEILTSRIFIIVYLKRVEHRKTNAWRIPFFTLKEPSLALFDDFDPNNNAVKEIVVQIVPNQTIDPAAGSFNFSVADKNGKVLQAFGSAPLPEGIQTAETVILKGHVNQSGFCTHEVVAN